MKKFIKLLKLCCHRVKLAKHSIGQHNEAELSFIIFSKDRALQLDALLRSIKIHVTGRYKVHILWVATNDRHEEAYRHCIKNNDSVIDHAHEESSFKQDLLSALNEIHSERVAFLVDDLLFIRPFCVDDIFQFDPFQNVISLRLWPGITHCQPIARDTPPPPIEKIDPSSINGLENACRFSWRQAQGDWKMPTSVDGNIFSRIELLILLEDAAFRFPNDLEGALVIHRYLFSRRHGICFEQPCLLNFSYNRVQTGEWSFVYGEHSAKDFLEAYEQSKRLDIESCFNMSHSACHIVAEPAIK